MAHWDYRLKSTDSDNDYGGRMIQCHQGKYNYSVRFLGDFAWKIFCGQFGLDMYFLFF